MSDKAQNAIRNMVRAIAKIKQQQQFLEDAHKQDPTQAPPEHVI